MRISVRKVLQNVSRLAVERHAEPFKGRDIDPADRAPDIRTETGRVYLGRLGERSLGLEPSITHDFVYLEQQRHSPNLWARR